MKKMIITKFKLSPRARIIKNLCAIVISFFFIFSAQGSIISVQSVLNDNESIGLIAMSVNYIMQLLSCILLPQIVIDLIGFKYTLAIAHTFYTLYLSANAWPRYYTMIPGALLSGLAQSLGWNLMGIYVTLLSKQYAKCQNKLFNDVQHLFFGIFTAIFISCKCEFIKISLSLRN